jgi:hypothetical protein
MALSIVLIANQLELQFHHATFSAGESLRNEAWAGECITLQGGHCASFRAGLFTQEDAYQNAA